MKSNNYNLKIKKDHIQRLRYLKGGFSLKQRRMFKTIHIKTKKRSILIKFLKELR